MADAGAEANLDGFTMAAGAVAPPGAATRGPAEEALLEGRSTAWKKILRRRLRRRRRWRRERGYQNPAEELREQQWDQQWELQREHGSSQKRQQATSTIIAAGSTSNSGRGYES